MSTEATTNTGVPTKKSYKETLNLPQTTFAMEAKLIANEPIRLARWKQSRLYDRIMASRKSAPTWLLHDGPPFANSDIHIGHLINKALKDVFMRYKTLRGFRTPYVPGWDCHGLPIEHRIQEKLGQKWRELSVIEQRRECHKHADHYINVQSEQFQRLGVLGDWEHPYATMHKDYEARTLETFAQFVESGLVYKQLKPVHWSIANQTALADAELEYKDVEDNSVFVEFPVDNPGAFKAKFDLRENAKVSFLIWTTTPWTLPANMAIAVHPEVQYALVKYTRNADPHVAVVAVDLVERVFAGRAGVSNHSVLKTVIGKDLVGQTYTHPFVGRVSKVVDALYVTTTDGTGLVHTAPGHGEDDYATGMKNKIEVYCPVLANGRFDDSVPEWLKGLRVWEANPKITDKLREGGALFAEQKLVHSYPHDWRSKTPTIFRATEQWFIGIDRPFTVGGTTASLRERALDSCKNQIDFIPEWGEARIAGMISSRPDWCISRQRAWGMPIPVFYNEQGEPLLTPASVRAVADRFREVGSDSWFTESPEQLLAGFDPGPNFPKDKLRKEKDIFDVWFESGNSWNAVLRARPEQLTYPADLYLEGSDQHRGWFQLSLLPALGATGVPPYKQVLTHGFVVKPDGKKVSKSDPEYVTATQEIDRHGADVLRLWTCSVDYEGDIPASPAALKEFGDKYRKIRNTLRYLLSNLYDFDPKEDAQPVPRNSLDGWAMAQLYELIEQVTAAYDSYFTHRAFRLLHDFCSVQISAMYGNAMKDRLYCEAPNAPLRRRSQTVMYQMLVALTKMLSPMLVFTADETWEAITHKPEADASADSVHLATWPTAPGQAISDDQREEWKLIMDLRSQAMLQIDPLLRKFPKAIKPSDMEAIFLVEDNVLRAKLASYGVDLADLLGVGFHSFKEDRDPAGPAVTVEIVDRRELYKSCARSWKRRPDVGLDPAYPDLSKRDADAIRGRHEMGNT